MNAESATRGRPRGSTGSDLLAIARDVLLEKGFAGTTMDEVAARARISKASLYREHPSKASLFAATVSDWSDAGRGAMRPFLARLLEDPDLAAGLVELGTVLRRGVLSPDVLAMRRLVTSEADAHPDVAARYFAESWTRNIDDLAEAFRRLDRDGALALDDPRTAADEFTWLVVGAPLNAALLTGSAGEAPPVESAVALFLARYSPGPG